LFLQEAGLVGKLSDEMGRRSLKHYPRFPVGSRNGEPRVVMDILSYKSLTAEEAIAHAQLILPDRPEADAGVWASPFASYIEGVVPSLRAMEYRGRNEK
jgi:hypothetical protein